MNYLSIYETSVIDINILIISINRTPIFRFTERWLNCKGLKSSLSQTSSLQDKWHFVLRN